MDEKRKNERKNMNIVAQNVHLKEIQGKVPKKMEKG